jgi:predicted DNA-binding transcriptional regulator AlpA
MIEDRWVSYRDLTDLGFINPATGRAFSRKHLLDMMKWGQWPGAFQISPNRIAWKLSELTTRYASLPVAHSMRTRPLIRRRRELDEVAE